jgi:hypothetical protein
MSTAWKATIAKMARKANLATTALAAGFETVEMSWREVQCVPIQVRHERVSFPLVDVTVKQKQGAAKGGGALGSNWLDNSGQA